ncbi:hypothetical protein J1N51_11505 [Psychrosphaera ytuae]|uniref:Uncharacterized protein n=1 Tax=Psychrosphaera ytuae TaxID=2820710 RepID=A0A975DA47_9GAMM|nr:hypothetical protein [Psychrosphaera ytuae]QTH63352.1 hypothetical protein J1N51_11505 [Psychrosphaera ytuae]
MITAKEKQAQLLELEQMLFVELYTNKLEALGQTHIADQSQLSKMLDSPYPADALLMLLAARARNAVKKGAKLEESIGNVTIDTSLKYVFQNLNEYTKLKNSLELQGLCGEQNTKNLNRVIAKALMLGYSAGAHDTEVCMGRHCLTGYKVKVSKPIKNGRFSAKKFETVKNLVNEMSDFFYDGTRFTSKLIIAEAIFKIINNFSLLQGNSNLDALKGYPQRCPSIRKIEQYISTAPPRTRPSGHPKLSVEDVIPLIKGAFPDRLIHKKLSVK